MGNLPPIDPAERIPVTVPTPADLMDHHFQGQPVLPAVVAMEVLARCAKERFAQLKTCHITDIRFEKFLPMDAGADRLEAFARFEALENGTLQATLLTRTKAPKAAFTRTKIHVSMTFDPSPADHTTPPVDIAAALEGVCTTVSPDAIYKELVPFGPSFRNINAPLFISTDGALAAIRTPETGNGYSLLGSGYALDAAFHAACVWAQHHHGIVAFPVAVDRRIILAPAKPAQNYYGRVIYKEVLENVFSFDIFLLDRQGALSEIAQGVRMRDVSGGRLMPPDWIRQPKSTPPLNEWGKDCPKMAVVELDGVAAFASQALTPLEKEKYDQMGDRRRKSYLAARIALKRLHRKCFTHDRNLPANAIETVLPDSPLPRLFCGDASPQLHCSVSHDRRFAIAVANPNKVGIDVEVISGKALRSSRLFMSEDEQNLIKASTMDDETAAVYIWSIKEAAAKATGINLAEAWQRVQVTAVEQTQSLLTIDGNKAQAQHAHVQGHLFTLISLSHNP